MTAAKSILIFGTTATEIADTASLLQDFLNVSNPADVRKLLIAVKNKPYLLKTAVKLL